MPKIMHITVALSVFTVVYQPEFVLPLIGLFFWREYSRNNGYS